MSTKRTRLLAVYLTDTERDLVINGLLTLTEQLCGEIGGGRAMKFATSYTSRRIRDVVEVFRAVDKRPTTKEPQ